MPTRELKSRWLLEQNPNKILYEGEFKGGHRYEKGNIIYSTRMIGNNNENFDNNMEYQ